MPANPLNHHLIFLRVSLLCFYYGFLFIPDCKLSYSIRSILRIMMKVNQDQFPTSSGRDESKSLSPILQG
jgi:hypothetical protein